MANGTNLAMTLLVPIAGGITAAYVDSQLGPDYDVTLFPDPVVPGSGVTLTPGLMGALAITALLAIGIKLPASEALSLAASGVLVVGLTDIGKQKLLPMITPMPTKVSEVPPGVFGTKATQGLPRYGVGACGPMPTNEAQFRNMMMAYAA